MARPDSPQAAICAPDPRPQEQAAHRGILVTGGHRSGTTWIGRMLALHPSICYLHEPFNPRYRRPGICAAPVRYWYTYVYESNEAAFRTALNETLALRYQLRQELRVVRSPRDVGRMVRDFSRLTAHRVQSALPLMKDPFALFSAEWMAREFGVRVVLTIRHPAAFAASLKQRNWRFRFDHLLAQPHLIDDRLAAYASQIRCYAETPHTIIEQAILAWNLLYTIVADYRDAHPEWIFIRHEDISRDPIGEFRELFLRLGLGFTSRIEEGIRKHSEERSAATSGEARWTGDVRRDSRANIFSWRDRLSPEEIAKIRVGVERVASRFYGDRDW